MAVKSGLESLWELRLAEVAGALKANNFAVDTLPDLAGAISFFKERLLPEIAPASVYVGGSETITNSGFYQYFQSSGIEFINPYAAGISPAESFERRRKGLLADLLVTSTNAVIKDGRLLNLDGGGNRVAAITFGPRKVVLFIGRNKICNSFDEAVSRIRGIAAPANSIRLGRKTPCAKTGTCIDCNAPERICSSWVLTSKCAQPGRIHILLINEDLGF